MDTKTKGDLLESIIEKLCFGIENTEITKNAKITGKKTGKKREIDILIKGKIGSFIVSIAIESKNYKRPVGIEKIESLKSKLEDIGVDLGVMICTNGFTNSAKKCAAFDGIKLFGVIDPGLNNSKLFIPIRYIEPEIKSFSFKIQHRANSPFSISQDVGQWLFHIDDKILNSRELVYYAWNNDMIPQESGHHIANFGAIAISTIQNPDVIKYCEISIYIDVIEKYYLKLKPASFLKNLENNEEYHNLKLDIHKKEEDMFKAGWKRYNSLKEMNEAADIDDQPKSVRGLIIKSGYSISSN